MSSKKIILSIITLVLLIGCGLTTIAQQVMKTPSQEELEKMGGKEWNNQIRREKFDMVLPEAMRNSDVDMWIHIMRLAIPDEFGEKEFGSTSGVFIFTDRGDGRIERAILGRRWGETKRVWNEGEHSLVEECGAYDIIGESVFVNEPVAGPMTEYDFRFKGLKDFVEERDPKKIAVNFMLDLGMWETYTDFGGARDGISHTDYILLTRELGEKFSKRLVTSEKLIMDYITAKVPSEIKQLRKIQEERGARVKKAFSEVVPGETQRRDVGLTIFRRTTTGESQRGRSEGFGSNIIQRGDIVGAPSQGLYAYVLRENEKKPPEEIQKLWNDYLKIDGILAETIRSGLTPREIFKELEAKFNKAGVIVRDDQMHMYTPKNNYPEYVKGLDQTKTHLSIDCHGMMKGARERPDENYLGPRVSSYGPTWTWDIPLKPNHHFVLEYFFYTPSPAKEGQDQYLLWWDHEQVLATENGVEYLIPPQKELILIN